MGKDEVNLDTNHSSITVQEITKYPFSSCEDAAKVFRVQMNVRSKEEVLLTSSSVQMIHFQIVSQMQEKNKSTNVNSSGTNNSECMPTAVISDSRMDMNSDQLTESDVLYSLMKKPLQILCGTYH